MVIAVPIKVAASSQRKTGLGISFRIELRQLHPIAGDKCCKGNRMLLCHWVGDGNKMLIFHIFDADAMILVRFLCIQCRKRYAAAAQNGFSAAVDHIAANWANIEF